MGIDRVQILFVLVKKKDMTFFEGSGEVFGIQDDGEGLGLGLGFRVKVRVRVKGWGLGFRV